MFHEFSIFSIFKRLVRNRLNIEKYCKDKFLCVFKNTLFQQKYCMFHLMSIELGMIIHVLDIICNLAFIHQ